MAAKPIVVQKVAAPAPPPAHEELVIDDDSSNIEVVEKSDDAEGHTSDNDARGAFDHF